jgi:hypothetical protein
MTAHLFQGITSRPVGGVAILLAMFLSGTTCGAGTTRLLDVTQPFHDFPIARPGAENAAETTRAIQLRLDYLSGLKPTGGRVLLPRGDWYLTAPLVLDQSNVELVGAGQEATTLQAAPGRSAMPLIHVAMTRYFPNLPHQAANWLPLDRILDDSIPKGRYGIRTYAEFPAGGNHVEARVKRPWAEGATFSPGEAVRISHGPATYICVCTAAHTATKQNCPAEGPAWERYWIIKVPATVFFSMNPFSDGAFDPATGRASNWAGMSAYTLDMAYVNNSPNPAKAVAGVCWGEGGEHKAWALYQSDVGTLRLAYNLAGPDGKPLGFQDEINPRGCLPTELGLFRIILQFDFAAGKLQVWVRWPKSTAWVRTVDRSFPAGSRFFPTKKSSFFFAGHPNGSPYANRSEYEVPSDYTLCGLHMANSLRYADGEDCRVRETGRLPTDRFAYFDNDPGTMAYLPLTDHGEDLKNTGYLVTQVLGDAAGERGTIGYGILWPGAIIWGRQHLRVSDMTILAGKTWGAGIVNWQGLDNKFWNLTVRGGFYAIGDLPYGCSYTTDIRDCILSGSQAAFYGDYSAVSMKRVTIAPCGRYGIFLCGTNADLDGVEFRDPTTRQTEYYIVHDGQTYAGNYLFTRLLGENNRQSMFPSGGAIAFTHIYPSVIEMRDCRFSNMGLDAAWLTMSYSRPPSPKMLWLTGCRYTGTPIAALLRTDDPDVQGVIEDCPAAPPYRDWVQWSAPRWKPSMQYQPQDRVQDGNKMYVARKPNINRRPGPEGDSDDWRLVRLGVELRR